MTRLQGDIIISKNINECFELFDFSENNVKKIDPTILFHNIENETENKIGSTYLQGRDDNGNVLETLVTITEYIDENDHKKISAEFNISNYFNIQYYYELNKIDENCTKFTYFTSTTPTKIFTKIMYKLLRLEKKYNVNNFLEHIKNIIE